MWALDVFAVLSVIEAAHRAFYSTAIFSTPAGATLLLQPRRVPGNAKKLDPIADNIEQAWYQFFREQRAAAVVASISSGSQSDNNDDDNDSNNGGDTDNDRMDRDHGDDDAFMPDDNDINTSMPDKHPSRR